MVNIFKKITDIQQYISLKKSENKTIGFVPTMGALHEGHGGLMDKAGQDCDITIVSIFVNLTQFSVDEDFERYPRPIEKDLEFLEKKGIDAVYLPQDHEIYPDQFSTHITMSGPAEGLESVARPHFFGGVATIVTKLFMIIHPDFAYFGLKDYQQFSVIKRLVLDLYLPIKIIGIPTMRAKNGLALSSRNLYLSEAQREVAPFLYKTLSRLKEQLKQNQDWAQIKPLAEKELLAAGFDKIDYLSLRQADSLCPVTPNAKGLRILVAVYLGSVRLIDNIDCNLQ